MELAHRMASRAIGTTGSNPAVGCIIVKKNNIIFEHQALFDGNRVDIREKAVLFALNQLLTLTL